ncbi:hypothetical protein D3C72_1700250 [compost metagenome]
MSGQAGREEFGVQLDLDRAARRARPLGSPAERLGQGTAHAQGDSAQHAVLAGAVDLGRLGRLRVTLLRRQDARAQGGHHAFLAVQTDLDAVQALARELQVLGVGVGFAENPGFGRADLQRLTSAQRVPGHHRSGQRREVQRVFVVRRAPVVRHVDVDQV